jgi:heterodisulfide reductase subunit A
MMDVGRHPNITLWTLSEVVKARGKPGDFRVSVLRRARYVDVRACTACGDCADVCPVVVPNEFDLGLGTRKAIYQPFPQAVPSAYVRDIETCLGDFPLACSKCADACEKDCINYDERDVIEEIRVGSIVVATGFDFYDPREASEYGYTRYENVVTSLELERLLSASGPSRGFLQKFTDGEPPKRVAFIQCVGSRCAKRDILYCSRICCMNSIKDALLIEELFPESELLIFYIDIRAFGKGFEEFYRRSRGLSKLRYVKGKPSKVTEDPGSGELLLNYEDGDTGTIERVPVDMVVLSSALVPSEGTDALADALGIEVDADGYVKSKDPSGYPLESTRAGVYIAGGATGPKDITDAVAEASGAAAMAGSHVLKYKLDVIKEEIEPIDVSGDPRIGVFVCHCGINIGGVVDVPGATEYAKSLPRVAHSENLLFACAESTQRQIQDAIREHGINRVVVAACTPKTHEPVFRQACASVGLNPYLVEMVNIRDQCSWVHSKEPQAATEKARDLIRMAVARASLLRPLTDRELEVGHEVLIVGGGIAGIETAIGLSRRGFKVHMAECSPALGGRVAELASIYPSGRSGRSLVDEKRAVLEAAGVDVMLGTTVRDVTGFVGNFEVTLASAGDDRERMLPVGAIVLAIGADIYAPEAGEFGFGEIPGVIANTDFEDVIGAEGAPTFGGKPVKRAVFIQCVGSRGSKGNPECSRYCCQSAIRQAIQLREKGVDVTILHRDVRVYSRGAEEMYRQARGMGVTFLPYEPDDLPNVIREGGSAAVLVREKARGFTIEIPADLVVLSLGMVPKAAETAALQELLKIPVGSDGFLLERHPKFGPVETNTEGIFLCGCAQAPKDIGDSVAQASAVASKIGALLSRDTITLEPISSVVDDRFCRACGQCVTVCEFNAIEIQELPDGRRVAVVNEALCKGCGTCAVACPSGAISIRHFTDEMIETMMEAYLRPAGPVGPVSRAEVDVADQG